jgi:hypothetical protein
MVALRHRTLHCQFSKRTTVHPVRHLSRKADIGDRLLHWQVALAGHNVAGRVGIHMGRQVVPLS